MVKSMTGYGQASVSSESGKVTVEIRSFNHRFSEITIRIPRQFLQIEDRIKKRVQEQLKRGKIELYIGIDGEELVTKSVKVDWSLVKEYSNVADEMMNETGVAKEKLLEAILFQDNVVEVIEKENESSKLQATIVEAVENALLQLVKMRQEEGSVLCDDVKKRIEKISTIVHELTKYAPSVVSKYEKKLYKKIKDVVDGQLDIDEARIITEVALFADKSNIEEELTRLTSHCQQFLLILQEEEPIGRKLDFLVQELNRESNTIGSKANDIHISQQVVELKSEIEKIKEQVQNIE
ncbi:YicC/YloC family endoribonuclease [Alkalihalobacillus sp. LMS39]|uniref:YicC/YloC family endoribonuclease n=1 Tax=Alkalihalobacillus sp. LMS39 TaxID=2924032 RepID=UPI001FB41F66|nr:YicC/YloC family endoribonuclease [Alkalihalobacillus sp. LMS39]UOE92895.1 YicC family protein [Alkalihalobacillus sp. LMS39]